MPKVYIIIVNFNGWEDTIECLECLLKLSYPNFQIIVVDNSTTLTSYKNIISWASQSADVKTKFPALIYPLVDKPLNDFVSIHQSEFMSGKKFSQKLILVKAEENNGFSAGNNIGLRYILNSFDGELIWLLNNDTVTENDTLDVLVDFIQKPENELVGVVGAKVLEYDRKEIIQSAGGGKLICQLAYSYLIGAGEKDNGQFDASSIKMDFVAGTSMFVRRAFIEQVGLLCENYFLYFEEPDWIERGKGFNWKIGYCYQARVYHKGGASTGGKGYSSGEKQSTPFSDFYFQRAKILFTKNYYSFWLPVVYLGFIAVILNRIRRGQFNRILTLLEILVHPSRKYKQK